MDKVTNERLEQIATEFQIGAEEVETIYNEYLKLETKEPKVDRAFKRTRNHYKRALVGVKEEAFFQGLIVGARELTDIYEQMRQKSKRMYDNSETKEQAIAENYISIDGTTPLDYRKKVFGTQDNRNYGKPLTGSQFQREMFCVRRKEDADGNYGNYEFQRIVATGKRAQNLEVPAKFKLLRFRASVQKNRLGIMGLTRFEEVQEECNVEEIIKGAMPTYLADEIDEHYLKPTPIEQRRREVVCIEGGVLTLGLHGDNKYIDISTDSMKGYIRCFIRGNLEVDFGEDSRVLVIGTPNYGRGGQGLVCSTFGIYSPEEDRYPPQE